ncbi:MAG: hypothetical protein C0469_02040 [Cyanobacteria bacterium DS2.3.42]|nr:hypothetical protein [Cyanobacteria bacterium DS2.3.42]
MKSSQRIALFLSMVAIGFLSPDSMAQQGNQTANGGISMTIYPVVRKADGNQYLITPSGKQVTVPGLVIAPDSTQVSVYRDQANHFWYTAMNGQQVAVSPEQLEAALAQINAQSGSGSMPQPMMSSTQSFYSNTPSYAAGFNGIPYGTPLNMEGPGQYSYMAPSGNKQFVMPTPQTSTQLNQWQQQVPYGQQQNMGAMQGGSQTPSSASQPGGQSRMDMRRERREERLDSRSQSQARDAASDQKYADSKMQAGQTLGTGISARRSAREERRSKREERRADSLKGN